MIVAESLGPVDPRPDVLALLGVVGDNPADPEAEGKDAEYDEPDERDDHPMGDGRVIVVVLGGGLGNAVDVDGHGLTGWEGLGFCFLQGKREIEIDNKINELFSVLLLPTLHS